MKNFRWRSAVSLKSVSVVVVLVIALGIVYAAYGSLRQVQPAASQVQAEVSQTEMSEPAKYMFLFHHLNNIKDKAGAIQRYKERMGLTDQEFDRLMKFAADHEREVSQIDEKARAILEDYHAKNPPGPLAPRTVPPPPPAELAQLQTQRNETSLRYKELFHGFAGEERFTAFKAFLDREFAPKTNHAGGQPK